MVKAIWLGIPPSYANTITGSGINRAYEQAHGIRRDDKRPQENPNQKQITTTSSNKNNAAGGTTSYLSGNQSGTKGWGAGAKTTTVKTKTYRGAGELMQINWKKYMSEGQCFNCDEKGHISKNCPKPRKQMDLNTGVPPSRVGRSDASFIQTDILPMHSDIPLSSRAGQHPVSESTNRYDILRDMTDTDKPTDTSSKHGITVGPHTNEHDDQTGEGKLLITSECSRRQVTHHSDTQHNSD
ncbi:hypothetical protein ARMGADRAFT_1087771 [Armillaria gallica]|uniref:CCHC-type domain-containing protein n=1 Tax=Armillaria gallica TaxID=47427 RepID=A0A2H3DA11_ARMGA|nr:hypothetical protein ARMGADRAFT_1087771 [Armillaria gallica]